MNTTPVFRTSIHAALAPLTMLVAVKDVRRGAACHSVFTSSRPMGIRSARRSCAAVVESDFPSGAVRAEPVVSVDSLTVALSSARRRRGSRSRPSPLLL